MKDSHHASAWRIEMTRKLVQYYVGNPHVKLIVLGGSPTRNLADQWSDLDIIVYWDEVDTAFLEAIPLKETRAEHLTFRKTSEQGTYIETYYFDTLKVDFGHATVDLWNKLVNQVIEEFSPEAGVLKMIGGFLDAIPMYGDELYETLTEPLKTYPEELVSSVIRSNMGFFVPDCLLNQGFRRDDMLFYHDGLCQVMKKLLGILGAINRVWFSAQEPRWLEAELARMPIQPDHCWDRMKNILANPGEDSLEKLESLQMEILDLVKTHVPDFKMDWLKRYQKMAVRACDVMPDILI